MKRSVTQPEEINQILLAMSSNDLKEMLVAMGGVLDTYLQEVKKNITHADEAQFIASKVADVLLRIDEILAALDKDSSEEKPLRAIMQYLGEKTSKPLPYITAGGECAAALADSPPSIWHG